MIHLADSFDSKWLHASKRIPKKLQRAIIVANMTNTFCNLFPTFLLGYAISQNEATSVEIPSRSIYSSVKLMGVARFV